MRLQDISFFLFFCSVFVFKWTCFRHENIQWMASFCFWSCFDFPPYSSVFWWVIPSFCKYIFLHLIGAYRSVYRSCVWLSYTHWFIYNHRFKIIKETNKKKSLHICTDIPNFPIYIQSDQIIYLTVHNKLTYLFLSVRELHTNSKMEEPPRKQLNKKLNHLVLGPAAGQGLSMPRFFYKSYLNYVPDSWNVFAQNNMIRNRVVSESFVVSNNATDNLT